MRTIRPTFWMIARISRVTTLALPVMDEYVSEDGSDMPMLFATPADARAFLTDTMGLDFEGMVAHGLFIVSPTTGARLFAATLVPATILCFN